MARSRTALKCIVNSEFLKARNQSAVYLAVDILPPRVSELPAAQRKLNVCLVMDRSLSMGQQEKLENAKLAASQLMKSLKPTDYISLITFADNERVDVAAQPATNMSDYQRALSSIEPEGLTDIFGALLASFVEARHVLKTERETISRLILLTDGRPTRGVVDIDTFIELCSELRKYGMSVSALGLGSDYNEELLSAIASNSDGAWYHITDPTSLPAIFSEELVEMKTVIHVRPKLCLQMMSGAELSDIYKVRPILDIVREPEIVDGNFVIPMGDIVGGQPQSFVVKLNLPPRPEGRYRIARVELIGGEVDLHEDIVATYTDDALLYEKETNLYPRVLLLTSEGTILLRRGISLRDERTISQADTIIRDTLADPDALTILRENDLLMDIVERFKDAYEKTTLRKGELTEGERKEVLSETTIIKRRRDLTPERSQTICPQCGHVNSNDRRFCERCGLELAPPTDSSDPTRESENVI